MNRTHSVVSGLGRALLVAGLPVTGGRLALAGGAGAQVMATLRNLAISLLRMAGAINIAKALTSLRSYAL
jgi:hypothetical protein